MRNDWVDIFVSLAFGVVMLALTLFILVQTFK